MAKGISQTERNDTRRNPEISEGRKNTGIKIIGEYNKFSFPSCLVDT